MPISHAKQRKLRRGQDRCPPQMQSSAPLYDASGTGNVWTSLCTTKSIPIASYLHLTYLTYLIRTYLQQDGVIEKQSCVTIQHGNNGIHLYVDIYHLKRFLINRIGICAMITTMPTTPALPPSCSIRIYRPVLCMFRFCSRSCPSLAFSLPYS